MNQQFPTLKQTTLKLRDQFNRPLTDLRLSVTDRCQLRCHYCMPTRSGSGFSFLKPDDYLSFEQIEALCHIFVDLGVTKIRLTGGEPLLRPGLTDLIGRLSAINGLKDLALTTNGILLSDHAEKLLASGLNRLTVSLDTLHNASFQKLSGSNSNVDKVLDGIKVAQQAGFKTIKINTVILQGINDHEILKIAEYFRGTCHIVRFIEYMDVGTLNQWDLESVVPNSKILSQINAKYPLKPLSPQHYGEVASRYAYEDDQGEVGFISSITQPFCGSCTRLRLSADGKLYNCLFAGEGHDLTKALDNGLNDCHISAFIADLWAKRADKYSENRSLFHHLQENIQKIDMFRIGG